MSFRKASLIIVVIIILLGIAFVLDSFNTNNVSSISSFEECKDAGYPIMESYPEQCATPDGRTFTRELSDEEKENLNPPTDEDNGRDVPTNMEEVPDELFPSDPTEPDEEISRAPGAYDGCVITGCSSHVCASEDVATTCEFREAYACYSQVGVCERRNNTCGWRQTQALNSCVSNAS
jgi:hypothetical protein